MSLKPFIVVISLKITLALSFVTDLAASGHNNTTEPNRQTISSAIDKYLKEAEAAGFSGAVTVIHKGQLILEKGYGQANREKNIINTPETVFTTGSVTKQFTATAILKLAEQNKLQLTQTISDFFEHLPADKSPITLHHLLTHSSGLVGGIGGDFQHIATDEYFEQLFSQQLLHPVGSRYHYSNAGYSVLARIIELTSGLDYESYLQQNLFQPAGMAFTGYLKPDWSKKPVATGYQFNFLDSGTLIDKFKKDKKISWNLKGNGGIHSTQSDMLKWYRALQTHQVITAQSYQKLTTGYIKEYEQGDSYYAYGWAIFQSPRQTKVIAHNGSNGTYYYDFVILPENQSAILFVTNGMTRTYERIPQGIERIIFEPDFQPKPITIDPVTQLIEDAVNFNGSPKALAETIAEKYHQHLKHRHILNRVGLSLLDRQLNNAATGLLKLNTALFPEDGNLWDSLGEAYLQSDNHKLAAESFRQALKLAPPNNCYWCENSQKKLIEIKKLTQ